MLYLVLQSCFTRREQSDWGKKNQITKRTNQKDTPKTSLRSHPPILEYLPALKRGLKQNRKTEVSFYSAVDSEASQSIYHGQDCTLTPIEEGRKPAISLKDCQWNSRLQAMLKSTCMRKHHSGHHHRSVLEVHKTLHIVVHRCYLPFCKCSSKKCFVLRDHEVVKEKIFAIHLLYRRKALPRLKDCCHTFDIPEYLRIATLFWQVYWELLKYH